jgi:hypothetical protein
MNFQDFFDQFDILEICHLSPDTFEEEIHFNISSPINNETTTDYLPTQRKTWSCLSFEGEWIKNSTSGGRCITTCEHGCNFWKNPQYEIETNAENETIKCAIVISLMQKYNRLKSIDNPVDRYDYIQVIKESLLHINQNLLFSQARIYKIKTDNSTPSSPHSHARHIDTKPYENDDLEYIGYTGSYINRREVTVYLRVSPGKYLVIPSTFEVIK